MEILAFSLLFLAMASHSSATWCACKDGMSDATLQKTLDYACGAGADCGPIHQSGACFQPNTVRAHCSYAVNSYFQKRNQAQGSCDFAATANIITSNPSVTGCVYPSSSTTGATPSTTNPSITTTNPYTGTSTGVVGGAGFGPTGAGINPDYSGQGGVKLRDKTKWFSFLFLFFYLLVW